MYFNFFNSFDNILSLIREMGNHKKYQNQGSHHNETTLNIITIKNDHDHKRDRTKNYNLLDPFNKFFAILK